MVSVAISTAGAIFAYFFVRGFSSYCLHELDPCKGQPVVDYYLCVFGCGLIFWLLVLLWPKLHYSGGVVSHHTGDKDPRQKDIREVAKLITTITTINLCGCLVLPFRKLPLLVRFLVFFQLSSNLAVLLICGFCALLSIHPWLFPKSWVSSSSFWHTKKDPSIERFESRFELRSLDSALQSKGKSEVKSAAEGSAASGEKRPTLNVYADKGDGYGGEAGASGSEHGGDGDGGDAVASGSKHGSEAGGREESGGWSGGDGGGGGGDEERGDPEHGGGWGEERGDPEHGVRPTLKISKISEMPIVVTAQTTAAVIGFHLTTPSFSTKVLLVVVLVDQLLAYLCGLTSMLLERQNPGAARVFAYVGFACTTLGYILMVAMFVHWYLVLITVLLFGIVWIIFFQHVWTPLIIDAHFWLVNNCLLPR